MFRIARSDPRAYRAFPVTLMSLLLILLLGAPWLLSGDQASALAFTDDINVVDLMADASQSIAVAANKAPIVPDGNVAGAPTDFVIDLDRSLNPAVAGRTLLAGKQIRVTLPDEFVNVLGYPGGTIFTPDCGPPITCNTGILLQGWPQHPIFPMFPPASSPPVFYESSMEGTHTIVFTALQDVVPGLALPGPGIKQLHIFALGFVNPDPGFYDIEVAAQTGPGGAWETGSASFHVIPKIRPSINVTSVFNPGGNPNTIYQNAGPGELIPLAHDFLLWDRKGEPMLNVAVVMVNDNKALLKQGSKTVGHATIAGPAGSSGQQIFTNDPSFQINAPVSGIPTGRLTVWFQAGDAAGLYTITYRVNGGNSVQMFVNVP